MYSLALGGGLLAMAVLLVLYSDPLEVEYILPHHNHNPAPASHPLPNDHHTGRAAGLAHGHAHLPELRARPHGVEPLDHKLGDRLPSTPETYYDYKHLARRYGPAHSNLSLMRDARDCKHLQAHRASLHTLQNVPLERLAYWRVAGVNLKMKAYFAQDTPWGTRVAIFRFHRCHNYTTPFAAKKACTNWAAELFAFHLQALLGVDKVPPVAVRGIPQGEVCSALNMCGKDGDQGFCRCPATGKFQCQSMKKECSGNCTGKDCHMASSFHTMEYPEPSMYGVRNGSLQAWSCYTVHASALSLACPMTETLLIFAGLAACGIGAALLAPRMYLAAEFHACQAHQCPNFWRVVPILALQDSGRFRLHPLASRSIVTAVAVGCSKLSIQSRLVRIPWLACTPEARGLCKESNAVAAVPVCMPAGAEARRKLSDWSQTAMFSFLTDNYDHGMMSLAYEAVPLQYCNTSRGNAGWKGKRNLFHGPGGKDLVWLDNGNSFSTYRRGMNPKLLCGACKFSAAFIEVMFSQASLGMLLSESVQNCSATGVSIFPGMDEGQTLEFFAEMDKRVHHILEEVEHCAEKYGLDAVLSLK
eukprot:gene12644-2311_t